MSKTSSRNNPSTARPRAAAPLPKPIKPTSPPPVPKDNPIKVRAIEIGYYDHVRRRPGDVFIIANEQAFSDRWMEKVDVRTRERVTTAKQALEQAHDEIIGGRLQSRASDDDVIGD